MKRFALAVAIGCGIALIAGCNDTPTGGGDSGGSGGSGSSGLVWQLQPGIDWGSTYGNVSSLAFGGGTFVAVGGGGGGNGSIYTSNDAITWTKRNASSAGLWKVIWSDSMFVAVGDLGTILTSPDGATWTNRGNGDAEISVSNVVWGGNKFVAYAGNLAFTSQNGRSWTETFSDLYIGYDFSIAWGNNRFVAVSASSSVISGSADGLHWTTVDSSAYSGGVKVLWADGQFVTAGIETSPDGLTWTPRASGFNLMQGGPSDIVWANGKYYVEHGGCMLSSTDGSTWIVDGVVHMLVSGNGPSLCYGNGKLVLMNRTGVVCTADLE